MKTLLIALLLTTGIAHAQCRTVYDPVSGQWLSVCAPAGPSACHNVWDAQNGRWVTVCR
jgi:hypothetical protein